MLPILVVGAGPAGVAAAVQLRRLGLPVRLWDRAGRAGGLVAEAWRVENHPLLPPTPGPAVAGRIAAHLERYDIPVEALELRALRRAEAGWIADSEGASLAASEVVLAWGTEEIPLMLPSGVAVASRSARTLLAAGAPSRALVVGGGEAAFDQALTLADAGVDVLIAVRDRVRARGLLAAAVTAHPHITLRAGVQVIGEGGLLSDGTVVEGPIVVAVGRRARACPGVLVGQDGLTVIGDAARGSLGQMGAAVGDGLMAAGAIARRWESCGS